jgi:hypothetical protein
MHATFPAPIEFNEPESAVGIATGYGLDDRGFGVPVAVGSRTFSSPSHPDWLWGSQTNG